MPKTIEASGRPSEQVIDWFVKHVGPRTHYLPHSIGGKGWRFEVKFDRSKAPYPKWYLTVDDEKMLMYWMLLK